jgi:hypothetical protein
LTFSRARETDSSNNGIGIVFVGSTGAQPSHCLLNQWLNRNFELYQR